MICSQMYYYIVLSCVFTMHKCFFIELCIHNAQMLLYPVVYLQCTIAFLVFDGIMLSQDVSY